MTVIGRLAGLYPWPVEPSDDLSRAVAFLGWETTPNQYLRASYGLGLVGGSLTLLLAAVAPFGTGLGVALLSGATTALLVSLATAGPRLLATARRTSALGDAPGLVGRAVLSMRLSPSPERAAEFATGGEKTALGASLARHIRCSKATNDHALTTFGTAWKEWFPALERSLSLVTAAGDLPPDDREEALDRALTIVLDGTRDRLRDFAEEIRGPVTALYAFGILLPTALVGLLPAGAAAGVGVSLPVVALLYNVFLPGMLVAGSVWLLAHRPATFPPPTVRIGHPDVRDRRRSALAAAGLSATAGWLCASMLLPVWAPPIAAVGLGVGVALSVAYRPHIAVHEEVRDIEAGLTDALSLVGRRVSNGRSVESAVVDTAEELSGAIGTVFADAATTQRRLQVDVERAFLGDHGALSTVPSQRVRESITFLNTAATHGQPAGSAILALADHIDELQRVEREATHSLQTVCGALRSTGTLFGPLVAGATVALAEGMTGTGASAVPVGGSIPWLGFVVGWYVLVLGTVLPTLATGLVRGLDRALVGVRIGRALVSGTVVYLLAYVLVGGIA
jgi:hypothetical protein